MLLLLAWTTLWELRGWLFYDFFSSSDLQHVFLILTLSQWLHTHTHTHMITLKAPQTKFPLFPEGEECPWMGELFRVLSTANPPHVYQTSSPLSLNLTPETSPSPNLLSTLWISPCLLGHACQCQASWREPTHIFFCLPISLHGNLVSSVFFKPHQDTLPHGLWLCYFYLKYPTRLTWSFVSSSWSNVIFSMILFLTSTPLSLCHQQYLPLPLLSFIGWDLKFSLDWI